MGRCNQLQEKHPSLCLLNTLGCHWPRACGGLGGQVLFNFSLSKEDESSHDLWHSNQDLKKICHVSTAIFSLRCASCSFFTLLLHIYESEKECTHTHTHIHTAAAVRPAWP